MCFLFFENFQPRPHPLVANAVSPILRSSLLTQGQWVSSSKVQLNDLLYSGRRILNCFGLCCDRHSMDFSVIATISPAAMQQSPPAQVQPGSRIRARSRIQCGICPRIIRSALLIRFAGRNDLQRHTFYITLAECATNEFRTLTRYGRRGSLGNRIAHSNAQVVHFAARFAMNDSIVRESGWAT